MLFSYVPGTAIYIAMIFEKGESHNDVSRKTPAKIVVA